MRPIHPFRFVSHVPNERRPGAFRECTRSTATAFLAVRETLIKALSAKHYTATIGRGFWSPKGATPSRRDSLGGLRLPLSGESLMKTRDFPRQSLDEKKRRVYIMCPIGTCSALSSVTLC